MTHRLDVTARAGLVLAASTVLAAAPLAAQPLAWGGRVGLASDWLLRGVRLSEGRAPVLHAGVDVYAGAWNAGTSVMRLRAADGRWVDAGSLHGGGEWRVGPRLALIADLQQLRYAAPLDTWDGRQWSIGLTLDDRLALVWNRQRLRAPLLDADSLDAALRWPLAPRWRLAAGLGTTWHGLGAPYVYGQAGLEWHEGGLTLHLQRVGAAGVGPPLAGPAVAARWVAGGGWAF